MNLHNLKKLIAKVEASEENIGKLNELIEAHRRNLSHNKGHAKIGFFVYGTSVERKAIAPDESLIFEAIEQMITRAIELNAKDKQIIEAIESMVSPDEIKQPLTPQVAPQAPLMR